MGFVPRDGIFRIFTRFLDWRVLDHLIKICKPGGANMVSPLAR